MWWKRSRLHKLYIILLTVLITCSNSQTTSICYSAVDLDGVNGYVTMGTTSTYQFANTTFSVIGWFRSVNDDGYVIGRRGIGGAVGGWFIRIDAGGTLTARLVDAGSGVAAGRTTTSTTAKDGNWHCLAMVATTDTTTAGNNSISLYYDGVLDQGGNGGVSTYSAITQPLVFGALSDLDSSGWLAGAVDDWRIYIGSLSPENIARICSAKVKYGGYSFGQALSYWPFDGCAEGSSGVGVSFLDRNKGGTAGTGTGGVVCRGSNRMSYPPSTD
jgi:Concanavalin A-like lectin/glucanases superfamily